MNWEGTPFAFPQEFALRVPSAIKGEAACSPLVFFILLQNVRTGQSSTMTGGRFRWGCPTRPASKVRAVLWLCGGFAVALLIRRLASVCLFLRRHGCLRQSIFRRFLVGRLPSSSASTDPRSGPNGRVSPTDSFSGSAPDIFVFLPSYY